ncbi:Signal transduction histidine kinase [Amycolatopsis arida]|uniref:histidine kinase n=1 Tax=Amycolatopsis arida TaxID=587909 RepID=A0A1I5TGA2_9PSEU|nr:HAMP domain-containing sensor histidine kinase [Amycolatopsis arida]TDX96108.1 signal transduction histidine kinase [Amycolatopsis arida]SFP81958.1 Signal transduction histidine kinase [Amycolatopsis arida]
MTRSGQSSPAPSLRGRIALLCGAVFAGGVLVGAFGLYVLRGSPTISDSVRMLRLYYLDPDRLDSWWPVLGLLALAPLVAAGCWLLLRGMLRPLGTVTAAVRRCAPPDLGRRVRLERAPRELDELALAIDDMLDRLAAGYDAQRRFAANASHELRTPLAAQRALLEVALEDPAASTDLRRVGTTLLAVNERTEGLVEGLLTLVEADRRLAGTEPVRLDELVRRVVDSHGDLAARHDVRATVHIERCVVPGEPVLLERLVTNLVRNAILHNTPGGRLDVALSADGLLTVRNTGEWVPAELVPVLFEPFRRGGADRTAHRGGAGLGLAIARSITTAHGGTIEAAPNAGAGGLTVRVRLPVGQPTNR